MPCKPIQTKLAVHDPLIPSEDRHTQECPDCAAYAAFDAALEERLEGWRDPGPLAFRRRIPARSVRLAYVGLVAVTVLFGVLALPVRSPGETPLAAYRRMLLQVRGVRRLHLVVRWRPGAGRVEDGPIRTVEELWWKPGAWREERPGASPILKLASKDGIAFYRYDPKAGKVRKAVERAAQTDYRTFDLASFAEVYMATPTRFERPAPDTLVATNAGDWSRMIFTLDPRTGLPTRAAKEFRTSGGAWARSGELILEFDGAIPQSRFDPAGLRP